MRRNGFTLVEVLVALTLGALVALLAHRLLSGVLDGARHGAQARQALDREMNARRWLMEAFGSLDVGHEGKGFIGRPHGVEFEAWQRDTSGSPALRRAVVSLRGDTLLLMGITEIALAASVSAVDFDYLLEPGADAVWVRQWISALSAPLAVRLRVARGASVDTLLFLIGPRG